MLKAEFVDVSVAARNRAHTKGNCVYGILRGSHEGKSRLRNITGLIRREIAYTEYFGAHTVENSVYAILRGEEVYRTCVLCLDCQDFCKGGRGEKGIFQEAGT
jgi:hypothetical protein